MKIELYDVVRLIDISGTDNLKPGAIGTVLEQYDKPKTAAYVDTLYADIEKISIKN